MNRNNNLIYTFILLIFLIMMFIYSFFNFINDTIDNLISKPKSKICVVMWYDKNISDYADICYELNKKYCEKNGYDIIKDSTVRLKDKKPHYERIPLIIKILHRYDYVIWIDSDAHFYIDSIPIKSFIDKYNDKNFIFSADQDRSVGESILNISKDKINTGVFIVKNTPYSLKILNIWAYDKYLFENRVNKKAWNDQGVLRLIYQKDIHKIRNNSVVIPYGILQNFVFNGTKNNEKLENISMPILTSCNMKKPFIRHMPGLPTDKRINIMKKYIKDNEHNLDFTKEELYRFYKTKSTESYIKKKITDFKLTIPKKL